MSKEKITEGIKLTGKTNYSEKIRNSNIINMAHQSFLSLVLTKKSKQYINGLRAKKYKKM